MILLYLSVTWVFASVFCAMLPIRFQYVPGLSLLVCAPILIWNIGVQLSPWAALAALLGVVSMFRNPLRFLWAKLRSGPTPVAQEPRE